MKTNFEKNRKTLQLYDPAMCCSSLGPLAGLEKQRAIYESTVRTLGRCVRATTLVLVSRPQVAALE